MNSQGMEALQSHKAWFYIGSILPDCVPSFLVRRHTMEDSFPVLEKEICKLLQHFDPKKGMSAYCCRHMGVITHYVSDYFTFPHNSNFTGGLAEHCSYEEALKHALRSYVKSEEAVRAREKNGSLKTKEDILAFIHKLHEEYLTVQSKVARDCKYIVELCHRVVDALLQFFEAQMPGWQSVPSL